MGRESRRKAQGPARNLQDYDFKLTFPGGRDGHEEIDWRPLGVLNMQETKDGGRYFELPEPFADLRFHYGEALTLEKVARLKAAIEHFRVNPIVTPKT